MNTKKSDKFRASIRNLSECLEFREQANDSYLHYSAISKCFEVCLEYTWKYFKVLANDEGIDVYSPKDALRAAARMGLIQDSALWIQFINLRNKAVHDYLDIDRSEYLDMVQKFYEAVSLL